MKGESLRGMVDMYKKAARDLRGTASKKPQDQDLVIYQKLTPKDFDGLVKEHGMDDVLRYIRSMETKASGLEE